MIDEIRNLLDLLGLRLTRESIQDHITLAQKTKPSYSAFLLDILQREYQDKRQRSLARRLALSGLTEFWTLETFPFHLQKKINKKLIYELAELDFINRGESVVFIGPASAGKTGLASSVLFKALLAGKTGRFIKAHELFDELSSSQADKSTRTLMKHLSKVELLVIDEFGYLNAPTPPQVNLFFRLMDMRSNRRSTILTTNLGFDDWGRFFENPPLTSALLGRLLQKCHVISIEEAVNLRHPKYKLPTAPTIPDILQSAPQNSKHKSRPQIRDTL